MIECIFTIDYEIYGNGQGSLRELVYEPAERLKELFLKWETRFVNFVEAAELEMIEAHGTDPAINLIKNQVKDFYKQGFELGLHLHPQWYKARYEEGRWLLDYSEYNLCTLLRDRIVQIIDRSVAYLRDVLGVDNFTPLSFRAGNWLFQPTKTTAAVLAEKGIKIDSSLFKGGMRHNLNLNYRPASRNGYYWRFESDVNTPVPNGALIEIPIYTIMVPNWKMFTEKRVAFEGKSFSSYKNKREKLNRIRDILRLTYPMKFDFCRMTINELTSLIEKVIREDQKSQFSYKPIVAIGHTKELSDFERVESFLSYLERKGIAVSTFENAYSKFIFHD